MFPFLHQLHHDYYSGFRPVDCFIVDEWEVACEKKKHRMIRNPNKYFLQINLENEHSVSMQWPISNNHWTRVLLSYFVLIILCGRRKSKVKTNDQKNHI